MIGEDNDLSKKIEEYEKKFIAAALEAADKFMADRDFKSAQTTINDAIKVVGNDSSLEAKLKEIEDHAPVLLSSLTALNSGDWGFSPIQNWNIGAPLDPFGNDYSESVNYTIIEDHWSNDNNSNYAEYRLYGKYKYIIGYLAPYTSISENGSVYLQITADDELVYTSPVITRKTDRFPFSVPISGAEYITIAVREQTNSGSLIMSEVMLWVD